MRWVGGITLVTANNRWRGRDAWVVRRGGTQSTLRARRACDTWSAGPSTSPLDRT